MSLAAARTDACGGRPSWDGRTARSTAVLMRLQPLPGVGLGRFAAGAGPDLVELARACSGVSSISSARRLPSSCSIVRGPMIGAVTTGLCSSQASATSAGCSPSSLAQAPRRLPACARCFSMFFCARFVGAAALAGLLQRAAQQAAGQRAPRDQAQAVVPAGRDDLQLDHARVEVVQALLGDQAQEVALRCALALRRARCASRRSCCCRRRAPCPAAPASPSPARSPPRASRGRYGASGTGRCGRSAGGAGCPRRRGGCGRPTGRASFGPVAHRAVDLGRQHDLLAPPAALRQPAPDDLLGDALAVLAAVDVGGVEEVDAQLQRLVHDREAVGLARLRPEVHRAQAQPADLQAGAAEVVYCIVLLLHTAATCRVGTVAADSQAYAWRLTGGTGYARSGCVYWCSGLPSSTVASTVSPKCATAASRGSRSAVTCSVVVGSCLAGATLHLDGTRLPCRGGHVRSAGRCWTRPLSGRGA